MRIAFCLFICTCIMSCVASYKRKPHDQFIDPQTYELKEISQDDTYGFTSENPIKVGGIRSSEGPINEERYLNALLGPNNETLNYLRMGPCCEFKTRNSEMGTASLDMYQVYWEGGKDTLTLYLNMYDVAKLRVPKGLGFKKSLQ